MRLTPVDVPLLSLLLSQRLKGRVLFVVVNLIGAELIESGMKSLGARTRVQARVGLTSQSQARRRQCDSGLTVSRPRKYDQLFQKFFLSLDKMRRASGALQLWISSLRSGIFLLFQSAFRNHFVASSIVRQTSSRPLPVTAE